MTQFGFKKQHSTTQQLLKLTDDITTGFPRREHTTAVCFNVQKAYGSVWHMGLLYKLITFNIPYSYIHLIYSHMTQRQFEVKYQGILSQSFTIKAGVPQGYVLAPTLYNIFTSDIRTARNASIAQLADDTAIYTSDEDINRTTETIQRHVNRLTTWFTKWRIKVNTDKTQAIIFTRRRPRDIPQLTFDYRQLEHTEKTKYLGVILDIKLTFLGHIKYTRAKTASRLTQLYPILT